MVFLFSIVFLCAGFIHVQASTPEQPKENPKASIHFSKDDPRDEEELLKAEDKDNEDHQELRSEEKVQASPVKPIEVSPSPVSKNSPVAKPVSPAHVVPAKVNPAKKEIPKPH
jgi:hypothetical protein